jgi:plastocyanin
MSRKPFGGLTLLVFTILICGLSASACGTNQKVAEWTPLPTSTVSPPTAIPTITPTPGPPETFKVNVNEEGFDPAEISAKVGDTVIWTNSGSQTHWVEEDRSNYFNSGKLAPGQSFSFTFAKAGEYGYHCEITAYLKGFIVVQ